MGECYGRFLDAAGGFGLISGGRKTGYGRGMIGYVFAAIIGLLIVGLCMAGLGGGSRARPGGREAANADAPPAADEPTPDRSVTATSREMDAARHHTPPA